MKGSVIAFLLLILTKVKVNIRLKAAGLFGSVGVKPPCRFLLFVLLDLWLRLSRGLQGFSCFCGQFPSVKEALDGLGSRT